MTSQAPNAEPRSAPLPLFLLGVGLGGFVDGIVLHQILQWHHMLSDVGRYPSDTVAGIETNTLADGLFHAFSWVMVVVAVVLLLRRRRRIPWSWPSIAGWTLIGWGTFNVVEGLVDHHLLGIHHVRDDVAEPLAWDLGFLIASALMVIGGWLIVRRSAGVPHVPLRR